MRKIIVVALALLALPVFLFVYQPSWQLGGFGLFLGLLGITISPLIVIGFILYVVVQELRK
ncbi:MAG: hypothetical protein HYS26_01930 [Candidatus Kaiserbacteria bacterium]|nr:MAG: hypothetical protein HYS26_01930 [Candidatus Kaiserbacteria bacterium]